MSEPDWRAMGDPLNDRLPPKRTAASMQCSHGVALNDCPDRSAHHIHPSTLSSVGGADPSNGASVHPGISRASGDETSKDDRVPPTLERVATPRCRCGECGGPLVLRCDDCGTVHE